MKLERKTWLDAASGHRALPMWCITKRRRARRPLIHRLVAELSMEPGPMSVHSPQSTAHGQFND